MGGFSYKITPYVFNAMCEEKKLKSILVYSEDYTGAQEIAEHVFPKLMKESGYSGDYEICASVSETGPHQFHHSRQEAKYHINDGFTGYVELPTSMMPNPVNTFYHVSLRGLKLDKLLDGSGMDHP